MHLIHHSFPSAALAAPQLLHSAVLSSHISTTIHPARRAPSSSKTTPRQTRLMSTRVRRSSIYTKKCFSVHKFNTKQLCHESSHTSSTARPGCLFTHPAYDYCKRLDYFTSPPAPLWSSLSWTQKSMDVVCECSEPCTVTTTPSFTLSLSIVFVVGRSEMLLISTL